MSIGLKLSLIKHDIFIENGVIANVDGDEKVAQDLKTRLRTRTGEVVLNNTYGFDYESLLSSRSPNLSEIESLLKRYILDTPRVSSISKFLLDYNGGSSRTLVVNFSVIADSGNEISISGITL